MKDLKDWIIYETVHGSHAYGTNIASSDLDIRGVAIPKDKIYYFGYQSRFEQFEDPKEDTVIFDIKKFMKLAADNNPNILEILYTDEQHHRQVTKVGKLLLDERDKFLSKKARYTFFGYADGQLKRIKTHRNWLLNPPKKEPTRTDYELPERTIIPADQLSAAESIIKKKVDSWDVDLEVLDEAKRIEINERLIEVLTELKAFNDNNKIQMAGKLLGFSDNFLVVLDKERAYTSARRNWDQYNDWKNSRNPERAKLEEKHGYDTKHGMHLVRLMRMCEEILESGKVIVFRPDAEELKSIRSGTWTYEQLIDWSDKQREKIIKLEKSSKLQPKPDYKYLEALCMKLIEAQLT